MLIVKQARSDSKRFPQKIYSKIKNKTLLENIIDNLSDLNFKICVCSTNRSIDKKIKFISKKKNCLFFAGPKNNVLKRIYECGAKFGADEIIRINGDSPLISKYLLLKALEYKKKNLKYDIISNVYPRTFPKGMSVEIIKLKCLKKIISMNLSKSNKEHVTEYIYDNPNFFVIKNFKLAKNFSKINLSVDTKKDLIFVRKKQKLFSNIRNYKELINKIYKL